MISLSGSGIASASARPPPIYLFSVEVGRPVRPKKDGFVDIFLDDKKIGEQKKPPSMIQERFFAIRLSREAFAREGKRRLVVHVKKKRQAGGIWNRVQIVILAD